VGSEKVAQAEAKEKVLIDGRGKDEGIYKCSEDGLVDDAASLKRKWDLMRLVTRVKNRNTAQTGDAAAEGKVGKGTIWICTSTGDDLLVYPSRKEKGKNRGNY